MTVKAIVKRFCEEHDCYTDCPFAHIERYEYDGDSEEVLKCPFDEEDGIKAVEWLIEEWRLNVPFADPPMEED